MACAKNKGSIRLDPAQSTPPARPPDGAVTWYYGWVHGSLEETLVGSLRRPRRRWLRLCPRTRGRRSAGEPVLATAACPPGLKQLAQVVHSMNTSARKRESAHSRKPELLSITGSEPAPNGITWTVARPSWIAFTFALPDSRADFGRATAPQLPVGSRPTAKWAARKGVGKP